MTSSDARHPRLSIVVPVYRIERYVARCLASLDAQGLSAADHEVIIVDDGSTDGSSAIVDAWVADRPWAHLHRQPNRGLAAARNAGLRLARGQHVWFVDGDDHLDPGVVADIVRLLERFDLTMLALGVARVAPDTVPRPGESVADAVVPVIEGRSYLAAGRATAEAWGHVYQREFLTSEDLWFPEGQLIEDVVFTTTALIRAPRVAELPRTAYYYVQRPDSIMHLRGAEHTRRVIHGFCAVVDGLDCLRLAEVDSAGAPDRIVPHLELLEQTYIFFAIARLVRSDLPFRSTFQEMVGPFRAIGMYPMTVFPGDRFPGLRYRLLTWVFNRPWLLRPFAAGVRIPPRAMRKLRRA